VPRRPGSEKEPGFFSNQQSAISIQPKRFTAKVAKPIFMLLRGLKALDDKGREGRKRKSWHRISLKAMETAVPGKSKSKNQAVLRRDVARRVVLGRDFSETAVSTTAPGTRRLIRRVVEVAVPSRVSGLSPNKALI
jgi:hypothetical protein